MPDGALPKYVQKIITVLNSAAKESQISTERYTRKIVLRVKDFPEAIDQSIGKEKNLINSIELFKDSNVYKNFSDSGITPEICPSGPFAHNEKNMKFIPEFTKRFLDVTFSNIPDEEIINNTKEIFDYLNQIAQDIDEDPMTFYLFKEKSVNEKIVSNKYCAENKIIEEFFNEKRKNYKYDKNEINEKQREIMNSMVEFCRKRTLESKIVDEYIKGIEDNFKDKKEELHQRIEKRNRRKEEAQRNTINAAFMALNDVKDVIEDKAKKSIYKIF